MAAEFKINSKTRVENGTLIRFTHLSVQTKTSMTCSVFIPEQETTFVNKKFPCLLYLSGLTCTDENVCQKSGIFKYLSNYKV